jgi:cytolysin-activating lysine-acyltransferase
MTSWNPVWLVEIDGVEYTEAVLANLTIRSGRTNIYEQAQAGYVNLQLLDVSQSIVPVSINSTIGVSIKDTSGTFVPIFGGNVVDIGLEVRDVGSTMFTQTYSITALGALARLPKALTNGVLSKAFDGTQIDVILRQVLFGSWAEVPGALTWATYDPTITWANAENNGFGEIDTPGNYELAARSSDRTDVYSLVSALATSGLGYIYEDAQGRPVAFCNWAFVSLSIRDTLLAAERELIREDWQSGNHIFIPEMIAPYGHARAVVSDLRRRIFLPWKGQRVCTVRGHVHAERGHCVRRVQWFSI